MAFDITTLQVKASLTLDEPAESDWVDAAWTRAAPDKIAKPMSVRSTELRYAHIFAEVVDDTGNVVETDDAYMQVLIGPDGDIQSMVGQPRLRARLINPPQTPEIDCGPIQIYD